MHSLLPNLCTQNVTLWNKTHFIFFHMSRVALKISPGFLPIQAHHTLAGGTHDAFYQSGGLPSQQILLTHNRVGPQGQCPVCQAASPVLPMSNCLCLWQFLKGWVLSWFYTPCVSVISSMPCNTPSASGPKHLTLLWASQPCPTAA